MVMGIIVCYVCIRFWGIDGGKCYSVNIKIFDWLYNNKELNRKKYILVNYFGMWLFYY